MFAFSYPEVLFLATVALGQSASLTASNAATSASLVTQGSLPTTTAPSYWLNSSSLTSCTDDCSISIITGGVWSWKPFIITATLTYATVLYVVSNDTGSTRTTTIYNTELGSVTPPAYTNAAGTITTEIMTWDPYLLQSLNVTLAYPTVYTMYPYGISWMGQLSTTTDGTTRCTTHTTFEVETLPSHPPLPQGSPVPSAAADPKGWTYFPTFENNWWNPLTCYNGSFCLPALFPDVGALHQCSLAPAVEVAGEAYGQTASFLTITSTSHVAAALPSPSSVSSPLDLPTTSAFISSTTSNTPAPSYPVSSSVPSSTTPASISTPGPGFLTTFYTVAGQTLGPGQATTISGTIYSLDSAASFVVVGGTTQTLGHPNPITSPAGLYTTALPLIALPSITLTPDASNDYIIGGQTLVPGQAITVAGTYYSLAPDTSYIVIGTRTLPLHKAVYQISNQPPIVTLDGAITPSSATQYQIGSQTLTPGGVITNSGVVYSLPPSASYIVIDGSSTQGLQAITNFISTSGDDSGSGGSSSAVSSTDVTTSKSSSTGDTATTNSASIGHSTTTSNAVRRSLSRLADVWRVWLPAFACLLVQISS